MPTPIILISALQGWTTIVRTWRLCTSSGLGMSREVSLQSAERELVDDLASSSGGPRFLGDPTDMLGCADTQHTPAQKTLQTQRLSALHPRQTGRHVVQGPCVSVAAFFGFGNTHFAQSAKLLSGAGDRRCAAVIEVISTFLRFPTFSESCTRRSVGWISC